MAALFCLLFAVLELVIVVCSNSGDHGGIPMGVISICDDAKTNIEIDWDPRSKEEYTCDGETITPVHHKLEEYCETTTEEGIHVCYPNVINYTHIPPTSGHHRSNWPTYGDYFYIPPQRWLHSLEHGGIVMLYHPCADLRQVEMLRSIVRNCLRRHIITPSKMLPYETPFALLSWGCKVTMSTVFPSVAENFIKIHAKKAPEDIATDGGYTAGLLTHSEVVSNMEDSNLCPDPAGRTSAAMEEESLKRRKELDFESEKLQRNMDRLIATYKRLFQS